MTFNSKEMTVFLKKLASFIMLFFLITLSILFLTKTALFSSFNFNIGKEKTVLILGDSHTQCAINDSVFNQAINLSESADTYFYSYIKLKRLLKKNQQIKTLVVAYSYHNVTQNQEKWLTKVSINDFKLPLHFFLFDTEDVVSFCSINGTQGPKNIFKIIMKNCTHLYRVQKGTPINKFGIGGYLAIDKTLKKNQILDNKSVNNKITTKSTIDLNYLKKMYDLAVSKNIKVVLVSTPVIKRIYQSNLKNYKYFIQYKQKHLPNALLLDNTYPNFKYDYFADSSHLNKKGSIEYTLQLKNKI